MMPYLVEFMKFLCGFAVILGLSLTLLYFTSADVNVAQLYPSALFA